MRFGVLGPLAVWTENGQPVVVPGVKVRALLADLLIHAGRPVSVDRLVEDLWGEAAPANLSAAVQVRVSQLRRALEEAEPGARELVASAAPGYALRTEACAVDAAEFAALSDRARTTDDPRARAALLADALALWRGPAYADFGDEEFTQGEITRLEEQRLVVLEQQAEARLELGEHSLLAVELGDLVRRHPFRERLRAAHMRALYRAGRQGEALDSYRDLRERLVEELGVDPGPELAALHKAILEQNPALDATPAPAAPVRPATNLPAELTELVGRDETVAEVGALLEAGRLVTLTGFGGVGKTRLAMAVARGLVSTLADGVWLVELAVLDRPAAPGTAVAEQVLTVLGVLDTPGPGEPVPPADRLTGVLRDRQLALVLDNCEHLVEQVATLVDGLLKAAPGLRVLATSREPLGLAGEVVWDVPPLEVPAPDAGADPARLMESSAVRLFAARATAAARTFTLDEDSGPAVAELCRRLDGIPLALELAAARVRALGVHGLVERLDDRLKLLAGGHRDANARHHSLTAVIDWSWRLLSDPERRVLRRLAVHAGGCTLESAEAVCAGDGPPALESHYGSEVSCPVRMGGSGGERSESPDRSGTAATTNATVGGAAPGEVLELLARLVDRSLVVMDGHAGGASRYRLLEPVAAYCADRLREAGEWTAVRGRHAGYYLELACRAEPHLHGARQREWLRRLDADAANLRAALDTLTRDGPAEQALRLASALAWYRFLRGRAGEARRSLVSALDAAADCPTAARAQALAWHAGMAVLQGDTSGWAARHQEALRAYEHAGEAAGRARAAWFLAYTALAAGDVALTDELSHRALETARADGDRWAEAAALSTRATLAHLRSDPAALGRDARRSAELFGELGDRWGISQATSTLVGLAEMTGDYEAAIRYGRDGLQEAEKLELWPDVASWLAWLGWLAVERGDYARTRDYSERALRLAAERGITPFPVLPTIALAFAARRQGDLDVAEEHLRRLVASARREADGEGIPLFLSMVLVELGFLVEQRGDAGGALALHLEAFDLTREREGPRDQASALGGLASALAADRRYEQAALLLGAAAALWSAAGLEPSPLERIEVDRVTATLRAALGETRFAAACARGGELPLEEVRVVVAKGG
jgi:predicted ATPase/DNA-binding SARP family transcriptional activator